MDSKHHLDNVNFKTLRRKKSTPKKSSRTIKLISDFSCSKNDFMKIPHLSWQLKPELKKENINFEIYTNECCTVSSIVFASFSQISSRHLAPCFRLRKSWRIRVFQERKKQIGIKEWTCFSATQLKTDIHRNLKSKYWFKILWALQGQR